ncbi:MAG: hypothetical protein AAGG07_08240 [Planctomycetota bacterium]
MAAACVCTLVAGLSLPVAMPGSANASVLVSAEEHTIDVLVFRSGRTLEGEIVEETATHIVFNGEINGIPMLGVKYEKADIIDIKRDVPKPGAGDADRPAPSRDEARPRDRDSADRETPSRPVSDEATTVYVMELTGQFQRNVNTNPIGRVLENARGLEPDVLVVVVDTFWQDPQFGESDSEIPFVTAFDQLFYAEQLEPLFTEQMRVYWDKKPRVVYWVKQAMGGSAFVPFFGPEMYFHPEGRIGGIGFLDEIINGDEMFEEKQISLRLGHAEGILIKGGYEPRLVRAMAREGYVLSYSIDGGEPVYLERMPENDNEFLLTDDGEGENQDTVSEAVRGRTNDVLTIDAETARRLRVSRDTVSTLEELMFAMGIDEWTEVDGQAERIMTTWSRQLEAAERELPRLWRDYNEVNDGGGERIERNRARGRQTRILKEMIGILRRFEGALFPQQIGVPGMLQLEGLIEQIKLNALSDRD